jgi:hypothetical protein
MRAPVAAQKPEYLAVIIVIIRPLSEKCLNRIA